MKKILGVGELGFCMRWLGFSLPFNALAFEYFVSGAQMFGAV